MSRGETIAEYSMKITNLVSEIKSLSGSVTNTEVVDGAVMNSARELVGM
jgi:hypothetical protein